MGFLLALQFLTIFPFGTKTAVDKNKLPQATLYFPLIGLFLGLILAATNKFLLYILLEPYLINAILIILLIILTGGLHLDGLADTFDALISRKTKPEMLEIMRDAHIGTMGVLSLISIILLKLSFLCSLDFDIMSTSLILMCLLSRYSLVLAIFSFPYVRTEGKAKVFTETINLRTFFLATAISLSLVLALLGLKGLVIFIMAIIFVILLGKFISKKIGGITGDVLGAINELTEVFVLLNMLILTRVWL